MPVKLPDAPVPNLPPGSSSSLSGLPPIQFNPTVPPPVHTHDKLGNILSLANLGTRALDAYSTRRAVGSGNLGNEEVSLPKSIAGSNVGMGLYSGGVALGDYLLQRALAKHGHPKLAHALTLGDIGYDLPYGIHNLTLPRRQTTPAQPPLVPVPSPIPVPSARR